MGGPEEAGAGRNRAAPGSSSDANGSAGLRTSDGATEAATATPPSYQRVFPPLLPPPDLPSASTGMRRSHRLLLSGAVLAVVAGLVGGAAVLVTTLTGSDDDENTATTRPAARQAQPGAVGQVIDTRDLSLVLEDRPTDGRLRGLTRQVDVVAYGFTDRVRLAQPGRPNGETVEAAEGEHWLVVELEIGSLVDDAPGTTLPPEPGTLSLVVDGTSTPVPLRGPGIAAFSVPTDAGSIDLVTADLNLTQTWSFITERRSAGTPEVLYRPQNRRVARIDQRFSLPYGATAPPVGPGGVPGPVPGAVVSTPFGERSLTMSVGEARMNYAVGVTVGDNLGFHTASRPDRALLYLMGINADWGGDDPFAYSGYSIKPEDAVLTLPDGTTVTATPVAQSTDMGTVVYDLDDRLPVYFGIFEGALVWDVPADLQRATLTIRPSPGTAPLSGALVDFRGGTIQMELDFDPST
jgi:hypothetical protein